MQNAERATHPNKDLVRTLYDLINHRQLNELETLIAADYTGTRGERGVEGFRTTIEALLTGFPSVRFELHDVFGEADKVAVRWTFRALHAGPFAGLPASHVDVTQEGHAIYQLQGGRIVRAWQQVDRLGVLQQIGVVPPSFADTQRSMNSSGSESL